MNAKSQQQPKVEWGFYAVVPRIVRTQYKDLSHAEKWLYTCLKDLCGDKGTCFRTLRALSEETDISIASLSTMIPHLQKEGLIHAEKKRRKESGKEVWHISIVDVWQANATYCMDTCSKNQQVDCSNSEQTPQVVQNLNKDVQILNKEQVDCSNSERDCSNFPYRRITEKNNNIEERTDEEESAKIASPSLPVSSSHQPDKPHQGSLMPEQGKKKKADLPPVSAEAERIIERWIAANGGKLLPLSKALVEAAEKLVPANPSKETLICIKNFALQHDTRGWYKQKGNSVTLGDIVNEYERWLSSTQSQLQAMQTETQPSQRNSLNLEENHKWAARMAEKTRQGAAKKG